MILDTEENIVYLEEGDEALPTDLKHHLPETLYIIGDLVLTQVEMYQLLL